MNLRISLVFKVFILVAITFVGTLFFIFSHNISQTQQSFMESERDKARIILKTLVPLVSITESFGFDSSIAEQVNEMKKHNPAIVEITINQENDEAAKAYEAQGYIVEAMDVMDYFNPKKQIGTMTIIYSNHHYEKLLENYHEDIFYSAVAVGVVLALMSALLYYTFLPLKKLGGIVKSYDFTKNDRPIGRFRGNDEVSDIANALSQLLVRMRHHTKEITKFNEHLQERVDEQTRELLEFNEHLKEKISETVEKIRAQDAMMIKQSRHAAMGEMIDNIAHQWKQPLNVLGIIIQDIRDANQHGELDSNYINDSVAKSVVQIEGMAKTIDDFKNFFRPEKRKDIFSLKSVLDYSCHMIESTIRKSNINIITEGEDANVFGFKNELSQVIINILNNAKDAYEGKGITENADVTLRIKKTGKKALLEIEDCAGGIPEEIMNRIFDPYFTTKGEEIGTGIGLYMGKTIIEESMNGKLEVRNGERGAIFSIEMEMPRRL